MFKLLTEEIGEKVRREYNARRTIVMLLAFIAVLIVGVIGLLPSVILSNVREKEALERAKILSHATLEGKNGAELEAWLIEINRKLITLSPKLDIDRPSNFVNRVLEQKLSGIRITGLNWLKTKDNKITLSVTGVADDRQTLVAFENKINSSGYFSDVTLPISDLAKDKDIVFQIKFAPI